MTWLAIALVVLAWVALAAFALAILAAGARADYYTEVVLRQREGAEHAPASPSTTPPLHRHLYDSQVGVIRTVDGVILFCRCAEHKHFGPTVRIRGVH